MRIPRPLQVFIPFGILDNALDPSRSKKERVSYGALFAMFVLALIAGILIQLGVGISVADFIRFVILVAYSCVMLYIAFVLGYRTFRLGKTTQGWRKLVNRILGAILIVCGLGMLIMIPCALFFTYLS
jgi:hypothetical protein